MTTKPDDTNPSNAVEKPATGCGWGCHVAADVRCPTGMRLWDEVEAAYRRYIDGWPYATGREELRATKDYAGAYRAYRAHVEASS